MPVIIRLQNLPLSARSGDIMMLFEGLSILDGGVHILGGDQGDAFVVFLSDEDARLAMQKDGRRIKDNRIKIYLSSCMEMQHEIEKVTKKKFDASFFEDSGTNAGPTKRTLPENRRRSRSRSPISGNDTDMRRSLNEFKSVSPLMLNSVVSSKMYSNIQSSQIDKPLYSKTESSRFFIKVSGIKENWGLREVQMMLKGFCASTNNIRWEVDETGFQTDTVFIQILNKDAFEDIVKKTFYFNGHRVSVNECPSHIAERYFPADMKEDYTPQNVDLCYFLKGLPLTCDCGDIIKFFHGYEIAEVIVFYGDDGWPSGTGFVSFTNLKDFVGAISRNNNKLRRGHIEMFPSTDREMTNAKKSESKKVIKSNELSPEYEAAHLDFLRSRDERISPRRSNRPKAPEGREKILHAEEYFDEARQFYSDKNSRSRENFRSRRERKSGQHKDETYDSGDRKPAELNPLHFNSDKEHKSCTVQLSNVDESIGVKDLVQFLRGFHFYEDTFIRRYTDNGEQTADVRVTFKNMREAKRAVYFLNGRTIKRNKVCMFIV